MIDALKVPEPWCNILDSLRLWANSRQHTIRSLDGAIETRFSSLKIDGNLIWVFSIWRGNRSNLSSYFEEIVSEICPGGVVALALEDHNDVRVNLVRLELLDWASKNSLRLHFVPPGTFWIQVGGGELEAFKIWNLEVDTTSIAPLGFNPSICLHPFRSDVRVFAFRTVTGVWEEGTIWIGLLDEQDLQLIRAPHRLELHPVGANFEDPRLYLFNGEIWLSYATSDWSSGVTLSKQHFVLLMEATDGSWQCAWPAVGLPSPFGRRQEKNWIFFSGPADELLVQYSAYPEWRIHERFLDSPEYFHEIAVSGQLCWPFGDIRGGTPFLRRC
jgi:hypothetical protein